MKLRDRKEFRRVPASELIPNARNWRTHPEKQRNALKGVLAEIGIADACVVREAEDGYELIDGHLRADVDPTVEWPCLVLDVSKEEADKLLASHDALTALAGVDKDNLADLLTDMEWESDAVSDMLSDLADANGVSLSDGEGELEDPQVDPNELDDLAEKWGTAPGQLWVIEGSRTHRLFCGDSTQEGDVAKLLDSAVPTLMVTDPPYGVEYDPEWRDSAELGVGKRSRGKVQNDNNPSWPETYALFPGDVAYVWHASQFVAEVAHDLDSVGFQRRCYLIWAKQHFAMSRGHYHWQHEPLWYAVRRGSKAHWVGDRKQSTVWNISNNNAFGGDGEEKFGHGTQKPVECMARPMRNHEGDVYDPFVGSGTTMVAAEQLGRNSYCMEIAPKYLAGCIERMTKLGCKPRLVSDE